MKELTENTLLREGELKQIYLFNNSLSELPERLRRILGGESLSSLFSYTLNKSKDHFEEVPCEEVREWLKMISEEMKVLVFSYFHNLFPFRLGKEELERMEQKWDELQDFWDFSYWFASEYEPLCDETFKEEYHNSYIMFIEYLQKQLKAGGLDLSILFYPLPMGKMEELISIIKDHLETYEVWINTASAAERWADIHAGEEFNPLHACFNIYYMITEENFYALFRLMQNRASQLTPDDYRFIYNRLREKGIDRYVQSRYDEYRSLQPGAVELRFSAPLREEEVFHTLADYINPGHSQEEILTYFRRIIKEVLPGLTNERQAAGFIYMLWLDRTHFNPEQIHKGPYQGYPAFKKEVSKAFHLEHLGDYTRYGPNKSKESAASMWEALKKVFAEVVPEVK